MSIKIKEIAFSCYAVTDFARARAFYEGVLGLKPSFVIDKGEGPKWAEYDIGGAALCIGSTPDWKPSSDGCTVALEVEDFDAAVAHVRSAGVPVTMEPIDSGVCRMAGIADPDGNPVLLHLRHPKPPAT